MSKAKGTGNRKGVGSEARVVETRQAGELHQVVTVMGGKGSYRKKPCPKCPWKKSAVGEFPAESFRHSARTAYDMSEHTFGCHASSVKRPAVCAGFLLKGAEHNLKVRLGKMQGKFKDDVTDGGEDLFESYRAMAVANGVGADEAVLQPCRDD